MTVFKRKGVWFFGCFFFFIKQVRLSREEPRLFAVLKTLNVLAWENTLCSTLYNHRAQQWAQSFVVLLLQTAALEGKLALCICWKICLFVHLARYDICYVVGLIHVRFITATYARAYCSTITVVTTQSRPWAPDTAIRWCKLANCAPNKKLRSYRVLSWTFLPTEIPQHQEICVSNILVLSLTTMKSNTVTLLAHSWKILPPKIVCKSRILICRFISENMQHLVIEHFCKGFNTFGAGWKWTKLAFYCAT